MLRVFISNNPLVVLLYLPVLLGARLLYTSGSSPVAPPAGFITAFVEPFAGAQLSTWLLTLGAVVQFVQAFLINRLMNDNKLSRKKNYVAGLLFLLFSSLFYETLFLSPQLLALLFCLWALKKLFDAQGKEKPYGLVFDFGTLLAVSVIIYRPSVLFLPVAYVAISIVRPFSYREWALLLAGLLMPFVFVAGYWYVFFESLASPLQAGALSFTRLHALPLQAGNQVSLLVLLLLGLVVGLLLPGALFSTLIQVRKVVGCLLVFSLAAVLMLFVSGDSAIHSLLFLFPPLAIMWTLPLVEIRKPIWGIALVVILLLTALFNAQASYFLSLKLF